MQTLLSSSALRGRVGVGMMSPMIDTTSYKKRLEEELALVERELKSVGQRNPSNPSDWVAKPDADGAAPADPNDLADAMESLEENQGIVAALEVRYNNIKKALEKIEAGTFGTCEISGEEIEAERLDANPAARTCIAHLDQEDTLSA